MANRPRRFVLEGTWSGYTSSQERVVHRKVYKGSRKKLWQWATNTYAIRYTDGTLLILSVRDAKPRERIKEINVYTRLIEDCFYKNVTSVAELSND